MINAIQLSAVVDNEPAKVVAARRSAALPPEALLSQIEAPRRSWSMESTRTLAPASRSLPDIMTGRRTGLHVMCGARTLTQTAPPCVVASLCGCVLLQCYLVRRTASERRKLSGFVLVYVRTVINRLVFGAPARPADREGLYMRLAPWVPKCDIVELWRARRACC